MKASTFISWLLYCWDNAWGYIWGKCGVLWTQKQQDNLTAKYNTDPEKYSNYKNAVLYGMRWIGHYVADCANLIRWAAKKSSDEKVHSGSNLIWDCDLSAKGVLQNGKRTDGQPLQPGTFVFTGANYDDHGHVGGYIGNGEVIEDVGTITGVKKSKITDAKWTWWGERKGMDFDVQEGEYILPAQDAEKHGENAPNKPTEPADDKDTMARPGYAIVTGKRVALRKEPSKSAAIIMRIDTGEEVKLEPEPEKAWDYVSYNGKTGWMMREFLQEG